MSVKTIYIVMFLLFPSACVLTNLIMRYATRQGMIDVPNSRSSHSIPKPRGGGLSFVILFLLFAGICFCAMNVPTIVSLGLIVPGLAVAAVGWFDDKKNLSALFRAGVHLISATCAVYCLNGLEQIDIGPQVIELGHVGFVLAVLGIVWSINMYNFMDGIDGLAASEAVVVTAVGGFLSLMSGNTTVALLAFGVSLSVGGFLVWNWPPAKIFMGDVGSGFLGFLLAYLALLSEKTKGVALIVWLVLLSAFIIDATLTLIRRVVSGEKWYQPHRTHAYELAVQVGYTHKQVTVSVIALTACLGVLGWIATLYSHLSIPILLIVFTLLALTHVCLYRKWSPMTSVKNVTINAEEDSPS